VKSMTPLERSQSLGGRVSVSSFCFHRQLGDTVFDIELEDGSPGTFVMQGENPPSLKITDLPALVRSYLGITSLELCQVQMAPDIIGELATSLSREGVTVTAVPIDLGNLASPDESRRRQHVQATKHWIKLASRLGAPFVRVNPGPQGGSASNSYPGLIASLVELAGFAARLEMSLLIENHGGNSADPDWVLGLLDDVGRERLGLILDTGNLEPMVSAAHARFAGSPLDESQLDFEPMYAAIERLAPFASVLHAKAYDVSETGEFGPVDLRRALTIARHHGFRGPITIEYEGDAKDTWWATAATVRLARDVFEV
jgi:sugar phosphate isomerase/epimerase